MSISSISSILASYPARAQTELQARIDLKALKGDLRSGNIPSAQQDFATLLKDAPQFQADIQGGATTPRSGALTALASALQSGNLAAAQTAMASLQATMRDGHHPILPGALNSTATTGVASQSGAPSLNITF